MAFITPDGLFKLKVMPFSLCSAPVTFQRIVNIVLAGLEWQTCLVYLQHVVVFSLSFDEDLRHFEAVLEVIKTSRLTLKLEKCRFV